MALSGPIFVLSMFAVQWPFTGGQNLEKVIENTAGSLAAYDALARAIGTTAEINGAGVGGNCDATLYTNYTVPLYNARTRKEFIAALQNLLAHLSQNSAQEAKSCFTFKRQEGHKILQRYNVCNSTGMCDCAKEGSFKSQFNVAIGECLLDSPKVGDPCDATRTALLRQKLYDPFRAKLRAAESTKEVTEAVNQWILGFNDLVKYEILESDRRQACLGAGKAFDQSMVLKRRSNFFAYNFIQLFLQECGPSGKCICVNDGKLFRYTSHNNGTSCYGQADSVCYLGGVQNGKELEPFIEAQCAVSSCKATTSVTTQQNIFLRTCGGGFNTAPIMTSNRVFQLVNFMGVIAANACVSKF